jgi:hypothetical protein
MNIRTARTFVFFFLSIFIAYTSAAQKDTLRVLGYNVLYYGNGCQGPTWKYHQYLKTIAAYANADLLSFEKMASAPVSNDDKSAAAPAGFIDSVVKYALNAAFPGRYAHCPFTNAAKSNNAAVLFYDQHKLGFVSIVSSYCNITDFNTYKLYYKDPNLSRTHDTTFLYLTLNHDKSGDDNMQVRANQVAQEMRLIKNHFTHLPNMINIGDFNLRNSDEPVYQTLTADPDTNFRFYDPPFYPDHTLSYPADWDHNAAFSAFLTTSTRESGEIPNSCGSGGGAKNWYDHIFFSSWIVNNANFIRYIPHSYHTVGNDGKRFKVSINNNNININSSAPAEVIDALYNFSNKYPVMASLEVTSNVEGVSLPNPQIPNVPIFYKEEIKVDNPVGNDLVIHFPDAMKDEEMNVEFIDKYGSSHLKKSLKVNDAQMKLRCKLAPGAYTVRFSTEHNVAAEIEITKE